MGSSSRMSTLILLTLVTFVMLVVQVQALPSSTLARDPSNSRSPSTVDSGETQNSTSSSSGSELDTSSATTISSVESDEDEEDQDYLNDSNAEDDSGEEEGTSSTRAASSTTRSRRIRRGGCYCNSGEGVYCGSRKRSGYISGDCAENDIYHCTKEGHSSLAKWDGKCKKGCFDKTPGKDYCK